MKYLKLFESLEDINKICKEYKIYNYTINSDGSIDVDGNVYLQDRKLTKLPLKFRNVSNNFSCSYNNLTSLEGCPIYVGGYFSCSKNNLTSLEDGPIYVGDYFNFTINKITSLEWFPTHLGDDFNCDYNPVYEIWKLFEDKSKIELFNYYDIVRGTDIIIDRLNDFLITIGKKPVKSVKGYNNI